MPGSAVQTISIDFIANYRSNLAGLDRDIQKMSGSAQQAGKKVSSALTGIGKFSQVAGTALLVGVGAALAVGVRAAIDFESAFAGVKKTLDGSDAQFEALATELRNMATEIPIAATELAKIGELGGQLGVPIEDIGQFTEVIALLGVTTNLSIEEAATSMARFANIMGTEFDEFENFGSSIVDLGNNFATTEKEILNFGTRLAGIGSTIGISEEDVLGLAAGFTALGEPAERGATALQRAFVQMQKFADVGGPKLDLLSEVMGLTVEAAQELIKEDPAQAFLMFERGIGKVVETGGNVTAILDELGLGAVRTTTTILKGAAGVELLERALRTSNSAWEENNALQIEADKRFETTASQMTLLKNKATEAGISLGEKAVPAVKEAVTFLQGLVTVIGENVEIIEAFIAALGVLAAGRLLVKVGDLILGMTAKSKGLGMIVNKSLTPAISGLRGGIQTLGGVLGIAAIALGAIAIGMANAKAKANEMEAAVKSLHEVTLDSASTFVDIRDAWTNAFNAATSAAPGNFFSSIENIEDVADLLGEFGLSTTGFIDLLMDGGDAWDHFKERALSSLQAQVEAAKPLNNKDRESGDVSEALREAENNLRVMEELFAKSDQILGLVRQQKDRAAQINIFGANALELSDKQAILFARENAQIFEDAISDEAGLFEILSRAFGDDEDAQDFYDDMIENAMDFGVDLAEAWSDVVNGLNAGLDDWGSAFEGYEAVQRLSTSEMKKSAEAWAEDQRRLTKALTFVMNNFSPEWQELWLELPQGVRAQLAAGLAELGPEFFNEQFGIVADTAQIASNQAFKRTFAVAPLGAKEMVDAWAAEFDTFSQQLEDVHLVPGSAEWATAMSIQFAEVLNQQSPEVLEAWNTLLGDTLEEVTKTLPEDFDLQELTDEMSTLEKIQFFRDLGFSWAEAIALGYAVLPELMGQVSTDAAQKIKFIIGGELEAASPSKWAIRMGEAVGQGFNIGVSRSLGDPLQQSLNAITSKPVSVPMSAGADQGAALAKAIAGMSSGDGSLQIIFQGDVANEDQVRRKVQKGVGLANMSRLAEIAPGRT